MFDKAYIFQIKTIKQLPMCFFSLAPIMFTSWSSYNACLCLDSVLRLPLIRLLHRNYCKKLLEDGVVRSMSRLMKQVKGKILVCSWKSSSYYTNFKIIFLGKFCYFRKEGSSGVGHVQCRCTLTSHQYAIPVSSHSLVKRITNPYGTQRPMLDKRCCPW